MPVSDQDDLSLLAPRRMSIVLDLAVFRVYKIYCYYLESGMS